MGYTPLYKLFHQDESAWEAAYQALYRSPTARHLPLSLSWPSAKAAPQPAFFVYTEEIVCLLQDIWRECTTLTALAATLPTVAIEQFLRESMAEEIRASCDIEGVRSTRKEIGLAMYEQKNPKRAASVRLWGIVNQYSQLLKEEEIPLQTCRDVRAFYDEFILREIETDAPTSVPDGVLFRKEAVDVVSPTGKVLHRGLYPEDKITAGMESALALLRDESMPELVRLAVFHWLFGYIHPFYDGNGRTARFITSYFLSKWYHRIVGVRLSLAIKKSRKTYYKLFETTESYGNRGDLTPFILGFLQLIRGSLLDVNALLREKKALLETLSAKMASVAPKEGDFAVYSILLQAGLFSQVGLTVEEIAEALGLTTRSVKSRLAKYPKEHIVVDRSNKAYLYALHWKLFL